MQTHIIDLDGPVHYADFGGDGQPIVMVHGLGGSHLNWLSVGPRFAGAGYRTLAIDLRGFGLTPLAGHSASVQANQQLLHQFIEATTDGTTLLMGNSMGGLISLLEADANPRTVQGLVLLGPALPLVSPNAIRFEPFKRIVVPSVPVVGPRYLQRMYKTVDPEAQIDEVWNLVMARPNRVPAANREMAIEMARMRRQMDWAVPAFAEASRSMSQTLLRRNTFKKMIHAIVPPTMLIQGELDRVADPSAAAWVASERPDWAFHLLTDVGHVPQAETPDLVFNLVDEWRRAKLAGRA